MPHLSDAVGRGAAAMIRRNLPDALIALGALAIPAGLALVHLAAALVVAGLELIAVGFAIARRPPDGRTR